MKNHRRPRIDEEQKKVCKLLDTVFSISVQLSTVSDEQVHKTNFVSRGDTEGKEIGKE